MQRTAYDNAFNAQSSTCNCCKLNPQELVIPGPKYVYNNKPLQEGYYDTPPSKHYQYSTRSAVLALEDPDNWYSYTATNLYKY